MTEVRTNVRTDERKDENYIPLGINAGVIISVPPKFNITERFKTVTLKTLILLINFKKVSLQTLILLNNLEQFHFNYAVVLLNNIEPCQLFSLLEIRKRKSRSHGKRQNMTYAKVVLHKNLTLPLMTYQQS